MTVHGIAWPEFKKQLPNKTIKQITLSDGGTLDESDGAKSIGLSFIQLISLLVTFPIAWPPIFVAIFQVGGAITVLGQHLVNLKW